MSQQTPYDQSEVRKDKFYLSLCEVSLPPLSRDRRTIKQRHTDQRIPLLHFVTHNDKSVLFT